MIIIRTKLLNPKSVYNRFETENSHLERLICFRFPNSSNPSYSAGYDLFKHRKLQPDNVPDNSQGNTYYSHR